MKQPEGATRSRSSRRAFFRDGIGVAGAVTIGGVLGQSLPTFAKEREDEKQSGHLTKGDAAMLRFAAAAEILESDFWVQYNELGGVQDKEVPGGTGNPAYTSALQVLDSDMAQYIHDNTDDEITHFTFL